jgi:hypothetical protein
MRHANPISVLTSALKETADNWSEDVQTHWSPPMGFFDQSADEIADGLKRNSGSLRQASARLNFYRNRAGDNLSAEDKKRLDNASDKLHTLYGE